MKLDVSDRVADWTSMYRVWEKARASSLPSGLHELSRLTHLCDQADAAELPSEKMLADCHGHGQQAPAVQIVDSVT